jgi:hypothetical protein
MKKRILKTITLGHADNPTVTICNGHVTANVFRKAAEAEGWKGGLEVTRRELRHEYWIRLKRSWKKSEQSNYRAQAVTVTDW